MKGDPIDQNVSNPAAVRRIQRDLAETLSKHRGSTILERVTAIYRVAQAATESAIDHSNPLEREENKRVMREVLADIMLSTLGPKRETVH